MCRQVRGQGQAERREVWGSPSRQGKAGGGGGGRQAGGRWAGENLQAGRQVRESQEQVPLFRARCGVCGESVCVKGVCVCVW